MMAGTMDEGTASHYRESIERARSREDRARRQRVSDLTGEETT